MTRVRAPLGWLIVALVAAGCSLNPQVEPPSALKETNADGASGAPIFSGNGGAGGFVPPPGSGGTAQGGESGASGATGQGGSLGSGGFQGSPDASAPQDGGAPVDAGPDARVDGGTDGGTDGAPRVDSGPAKDARTD
jgi:hypothetical protein